MFRCSILLFLVAVLYTCPAVAQSPWCGTQERAVAQPATSADRQQMELVQQAIAQEAANRNNDTLIIIPVAVHIIHWNGFGDISDEQVLDGLRVMNEDFGRENADTVNTDSIFKPFAANVGIRFELAQLDPDGNPTTGITRSDTNMIPHPEPYDPAFDNVKHYISWPAHKYYNVWLTRTIAGGTLGYAQYPGTDFTYGGPWSTYGMVVRSNQWGTIGTSSADGRTPTHEMGHCLGLYHTFLSASAGCGAECDTTGDEVCDTPPAQSNFQCPANLNGCSNDSLGPSAFATDVKDQKENFMSYSTCQNMFSLGQKERMRGFFNAFDTLRNLSTFTNLVETGVWQVPAGRAGVHLNATPLMLHPNPTRHRCAVQWGPLANESAQLRLCSLTGQVVFHTSIASGAATLELPTLAPGLYLVELSTISGQHATSKLIIQ